MALSLGRSYGAWVANTPFGIGDFILESSQDNITATASGTQANAYQIVSQTARIATVATAADSVQLPPSAPGMELLIINHGANPMQVYGNAVEAATIDDIATATGVSQLNNSMVIYTCATAGKWYSEGLSTGFSTTLGMQTVTSATVAANATGTQASGTPIKSLLNNVTSVAGSYSVTLPVSVPGLEITINNISANSEFVFPNAGGTTTETINALSANASITMLTNTSAVFTCVVAGQWYTTPRVPS